jgi:hypothetical protein
MKVGTIPYLSKVCLPHNLKIHLDDRIKEHKTRKACCVHGTAEKFQTFQSEIMPWRYDMGDPSQHKDNIRSPLKAYVTLAWTSFV